METKLKVKKEPSSERRMHIKIYEKDPDVKAIIHAHPRYATSFAVTFQKLPVYALPESALVLDPITYIEYQMPGTQAFADAFEEGLKKRITSFCASKSWRYSCWKKIWKKLT